jgi:hypothetical protein
MWDRGREKTGGRGAKGRMGRALMWIVGSLFLGGGGRGGVGEDRKEAWITNPKQADPQRGSRWSSRAERESEKGTKEEKKI